MVVMKLHKLRICLDPFHLSKAVTRSYYQAPTVEEIMPQSAGAKCFSLLDMQDGFVYVKLTEEHCGHENEDFARQGCPLLYRLHLRSFKGAYMKTLKGLMEL